MASLGPDNPIVSVVGFHHARGPEIESWFGVEDGTDPAADNDWSYLPFMALSDGAHASAEDFSYFTLRRRSTSTSPAPSAFGISCTRQMDANDLINRPADVTRSTVQKAVVVIAPSPQLFGHLREKLSMVTGAWFAQRDFTDVDILKKFQESLSKNLQDTEDDRDIYLGLSLRSLIYEYKHQTLVLFKAMLLQPKMLFYATRCESLCLLQFSLISLIPSLLSHSRLHSNSPLSDCSDPLLDTYAQTLMPPSSLSTSSRPSLLTYMGLPLQIFGKGSLFGPYTPLQQLDILADSSRTTSYIVGSTNSLLLQQRERYSDIFINVDDSTVSISNPAMRNALSLSAADRRWIDFLTQTVTSTWDPQNPTRPITLAYMGSEEFIRLQFEEYLLALLSSIKYHFHLTSSTNNNNKSPLHHHPHPTVPEDPITDFSPTFLASFLPTPCYALFARTTRDAHLFDIVEPRHPTAGAITIEDVQRRISQQIQTLHLDDRLNTTKEHLGKHFATGKERVSTAVEKLRADLEAYKEQRRKAYAEAGSGTPNSNSVHRTVSDASTSGEKAATPSSNRFPTAAATARAPDLSAAQASVAAAGQRAGAYMSSWGSWAAEKRKGWGGSTGGGVGGSATGTGGGGWTSGWRGTGSTVGGGGEKVTETTQTHIRSPGKKKSREVTGGDGIGRLDA